MSKFALVKPENVPSPLRAGEYVVNMPDFITEIKNSRGKPNIRNNVTHASHLRSIANLIAIAYDTGTDPAAVVQKVGVHQFEGRPFNNDQELSQIVKEMMQHFYPEIFAMYIDKQLKARPPHIKVIYFTGPIDYAQTFFNNGLDRIEPNEVDTFLGLKGKKVVGKPAITNEEANNG